MSAFDRFARAEIDTATLGNNTIITAPSVGHIEIDHISVIPTGGSNLLSFKDGSTQMFAFNFDDNQGWTFDKPIGNPGIVLNDASNLVVSLGSATQVSGFILYRVVGESV